MEQLEFGFMGQLRTGSAGEAPQAKPQPPPLVRRKKRKRRVKRHPDLPKGHCKLKERPCVSCGKTIKARYPRRCKSCRRHVELYDDTEYSVAI